MRSEQGQLALQQAHLQAQQLAAELLQEPPERGSDQAGSELGAGRGETARGSIRRAAKAARKAAEAQAVAASAAGTELAESLADAMLRLRLDPAEVTELDEGNAQPEQEGASEPEEGEEPLDKGQLLRNKLVRAAWRSPGATRARLHPITVSSKSTHERARGCQQIRRMLSASAHEPVSIVTYMMPWYMIYRRSARDIQLRRMQQGKPGRGNPRRERGSRELRGG